MKLTKVILVCNDNHLYYQYAKDVYDLWAKRIKIQPHLFIISDNNLDIDFGQRSVQYIKPIPDIPTAFQSQVIRLLLPCLYKDDYVIITDIDMLPIQKKMFRKVLKHLNNDMFVQYFQNYQMCYNCGKGENWQRIFNITQVSEIKPLIKKWFIDYNGIHTTDQHVLKKYLHSYNGQKLILTSYLPNKTLIRRLSTYSDTAILFKIKDENLNQYVDFHAHGIFHDKINLPFYNRIVSFLLKKN